MKILTSLLMAGLLMFPALSFAATTTPNATLIAQLTAELKVLETELASILASQAGTVGTQVVGTQTVGGNAASQLQSSYTAPALQIVETDLQTANSTCANAYAGTSAQTCENWEIKLGSDIKDEVDEGVSSSTEAAQIQNLQGVYTSLFDEYNLLPAEIETGNVAGQNTNNANVSNEQNVVQNEMNFIQEDIRLL